MQARPNFIDLRSKSSDSVRPGFPSPRSAQQSPRMQHFAGDIPPAMSPLDMFAMHSRLLAKQLDDSQRDGRRISRLPPLSTADPIARQGTAFDRSRSADAKNTPPPTSPRAQEEELPGIVPEVEEPQFRPKSFYPRMSTVPPAEDDDFNSVAQSLSDERSFITPVEHTGSRQQEYFAVPQAKSPDSLAPHERIPESTHVPSWVFSARNQDLQSFHHEPQRGPSLESTSSRSANGSLAPPMVTRSPHTRQSPSIRSIPQDSSDDELSASTGGSSFSRHRKLSSSSNVSLPHSPFSPFAQAAHARSPSLNSEYSLSNSRQPRPTFNFSRPLSRSSRPSMDVNSRQPSFDRRPSFDAIRPPFSSASRQHSEDSQRNLFLDDGMQTPVSTDHEDSPSSKDAPAASYIYTKYSLPRGRVIQKNPKVLQNKQVPLFEWERPLVQTNVRPTTPLAGRPMSPSPSRGSPKASTEPHRSSPRPSFEQRPQSSPRPSIDQARLNAHRSPPAPVHSDDKSEYSASTKSGSTIKASSQNRAPAPSIEVTAEDHLAKGISLHERGEIKESTYHLRIAAKQNLPTAMLLYALACRHGWGMRPNPQEGVAWLRKAADCASLEIATNDDDDQQTTGGDVMARKQRKAQFAYAIYELGVSHMNGLGLEQDKTLALRCFEIAASWGDADAMTESGFCYAQGQGCKKDLKKAAKYYKMAEAKGVSMVGNSW